jgi:hypothetical protein
VIDLPGEAYLFNLSLLAVTFAAVSVLVMLVRQTMGGKLSNFDIHLLTSFVARGFAVAVAAVLPSLFLDLDFSRPVFWATTSGLAAFLFAATMALTLRERHRVTSGAALPPFLLFAVSLQWIAALMLAANAVVPWHNMFVFKAALTVSLALIMWAFVRRVGSLVGDKPSDDWDPNRG